MMLNVVNPAVGPMLLADAVTFTRTLVG